MREVLVRLRGGTRRVLGERTRTVRLTSVGFAIAPGYSTSVQSALSGQAQALLARIGNRRVDVKLAGLGFTHGSCRWEPAQGSRLRKVDGKPWGSAGLSDITIEAIVISTMLAALDRSDPSPLHDQVAAQIRRAIAEGDAAPGQRLPPAKDLAAVMGVNSNTVLRALRALRDEGLLEFRRGLGIRVAGTAERGAVLARAGTS